MSVMYSDSPETLPFDFLPYGEDVIEISDAGLEQAQSLSQTLRDPQSQQRGYLALLALEGFCEWMDSHEADRGVVMSCDRRQAKLLVANQPDQPMAITPILVNQHFRVCVIATTDLDNLIELPQRVLENPKYAAHFYVNMLVNFEAGVAAFRGFLRHDQFQTYRNTNDLRAIDGIYPIPTSQFETRSDRFLLLSKLLNPQAIALPESDRVFTPERLTQVLVQPVINAASWLQRQVDQQLDQASQALTEMLSLPDDLNPAFASAMRGFRSSEQVADSPFRDTPFREMLADALQAMRQQGYVIPITVQATYQDLWFDQQMIRLTIAAWQLPPDEAQSEPEWSLLVIARLTTSSSEPIQIQIRQPEQVLSTAELINAERFEILQAIGYLHEQFTVEIANSQTELVLPAFKFEA